MRPSRTVTTLALTLALVFSATPFASAVLLPHGVDSTRLVTSAYPSPTPVLPELSSFRTPARRAMVADNRLLVRLKTKATAEQIARVWSATDTTAGAVSVVADDLLAFTPPAGVSASELEQRLEATGLVTYAEPNYLRQFAYVPPAFVSPNDPAYTSTDTLEGRYSGGSSAEQYPLARSWWLRDVGALPATNSGTDSAWQTGLTGSNIVGKYPLRATGSAIKVAVIDSGVYTDHLDIGTNISRAYGDGAPASPSSVEAPLGYYYSYDEKVALVSHGTCVAGIISAAVNNGKGTLGLAGDTKVIVYKVYFGGQGIEDSDIIAAIYRAVSDGCKVINLSIAGGPSDAALQTAIDYAWGRGCVVVAASGNANAPAVDYPSRMNNVLAVGALSRAADGATDLKAYFSNYGTGLDITAPGVRIWGLSKPTYKDASSDTYGYRWWDGTSMASPAVAGGIAWLWRAAPALKNYEIVNLVRASARPMGNTTLYGAGAFDMLSAYNKLIADYPHLLAPTVDVVPASSSATALATWSAVSGRAVTYDVWLDGNATRGVTGTSRTLDLRPRVTSLRYYRRQLLWSHTPADGTHVTTIAPRSPYNWTDGTEKKSFVLTLPSGAPHVDRVSIDGAASVVTSHGAMPVGVLPVGKHTAIVTVTDSLGNSGSPVHLAFTIRPRPTVARMTATDRYGYAVAASRAGWADGTAPAVVLASGATWTNALAAAPLGKSVKGPVLLTSATSVPASTRTELVRLHARTVLLVGGTTSVGDSVKRWLGSHGYRVVRISGTDRYTTANAIARAIAARQGGTLAGRRVVVAGDSYTDALAASAVAARKGWPLLYSPSGSVRASTRTTLKAIGAKSTLLVARTVTVSNAAKSQLPSATRVTANTALGVPTALAAWATTHYPADFSGERTLLASSSAWSNGLGLSALAGRGGWLVLSTPPTLASQVRSYYTARSEIAVTTRVVATSAWIGDSAVSAIKSIVGAP